MLKEQIYPGLEQIHLPLNMNIYKKQKYLYHKDRKIIAAACVYEKLINVVEKRHLPIYYANETMRRLLKRNKWLYSYKHQIIELIWVLSETNDIRFKSHIDYFCKEINYVKPI